MNEVNTIELGFMQVSLVTNQSMTDGYFVIHDPATQRGFTVIPKGDGQARFQMDNGKLIQLTRHSVTDALNTFTIPKENSPAVANDYSMIWATLAANKVQLKLSGEIGQLIKLSGAIADQTKEELMQIAQKRNPVLAMILEHIK